ncbi:MAG: class I SAM-dependent methyltransferase [Anaerolineae bacterium]|nr:class I SAM-dependent methyltransferase [Anaerolineae bacterium]
MRYFVRPLESVYLDPKANYYREYKTYTAYNYLRPGISSYLKTRHFDAALTLTQGYFHGCNVIDFGCADGVFIPSLSRYFNRVMAVDRNRGWLDIARELVAALGLDNVELVCNDNLTVQELGSRLTEPYHVLFLLETLEHIGVSGELYPSKIRFLQEVARLVDHDGLLVVSVPKMVGPMFLLQRIGLRLLGSYMEPISLRDFILAAFLYRTEELERRWNGGHLGFNHRKLEACLGQDFRVVARKSLMFQIVYVLTRK